jgi:CRISPR/Cas system CSM-associated protein Csm3 (group 7 of RAMP superfamily)
VPGTSLAGILRHRALRIVNTIAADEETAKCLVDHIFGADTKKPKEDYKKKLKEYEKVKKTNPNTAPLAKKLPFASRLEVKETVVNNARPLVQARIKIDRFTGGAYESALFDEASIFGTANKEAMELELKLRTARLQKEDGNYEEEQETSQRTNGEIGLLLLLLKDLWTGDLPIGGESSIGRGRLKGLGAELICQGQEDWHAKLVAGGDGKIMIKPITEQENIGSTKTHAELNEFIKALHQQLGHCMERDEK